MEKIGEIRAAISAFRNSTVYLKSKTRWETDFNLYRLKPYDAGKGYYSYTSNSPYNLVRRGNSMLVEAKLVVRIPEDVLQSEEERNKASNIERLLHGSLTVNDERLIRIPDMPTLKAQMAWYATVRGTIVIRPYVYKDKKGNTIIDIAAWDIYNVAYGTGRNGASWATNTYKATKEEIKETYDIDIKGRKEAEVVDFWDTKNNGVIVDNQWAKELKPHGLDYTPVFIIRTGEQPPIQQENYEYANVHQGESILAPNRNIYPMKNKTLSDWATIVRRGVKVPLGYWSAGGQKTLDEDIWQVEKAGVVPMDSTTNEKIEPLLQPTMPTDAGAFVNIVSSEEQRGGISHIAQGEVGFRLSGFAINQVRSDIYIMIIPFVDCLERAYKVSFASILEQYSKGGWKPIEVWGRTSRNTPFGIPKAVKIKPSDIEGTWHPEVRLVPQLPKDDAQRYELARLAHDSGFLSLDTIQDSLLGIDDTLLEQEKIAREWAKHLPLIQLWDAFEGYLAAEDYDRAGNVMAEIQAFMGAQGAQGATRRPPSGANMSPEVMPPEMGGGMPPGAKNARMSIIGEEV